MGDAPPSMDLESFLTNDATNSGAWNINDTGPGGAIWSSILDDGTVGLHVNDGSGTTLSISASAFWDLTFSNSANPAAFKDTSPVVLLPSDKTIQGAVLSLTGPTTGVLSSGIPFATVRTTFGIKDNNTTALLATLLSDIDATGALQVTLNPVSSQISRNALWMVPGTDAYRVVISLVFDFSTAGIVAQIQSLLEKYLGLNLSLASVAPQVVMTSITSYTQSSPGSEPLTISSTYQMELRVMTASFLLSAVFTPDGMSLALSDSGPNPTQGNSILGQLSSEVGTPTGLGANDIPDSSKPNASAFDKFVEKIMLWYVVIGLDGQSTATPGDPAPTPTLSDVYWQLGFFGTPTSSVGSALLAVTIDTRIGVYQGRLLFSSDTPDPNALRQYDLMTWTIPPKSLDFSQLSSGLDLASFRGGSTPPSQVPQQITDAVIQISRPPSSSSDGSFSFDVSCKLAGIASSPNPGAAPSNFDSSFVEISLYISNDGSSTTADIQVLLNVLLDNSQASSPDPPLLYVDLEYQQGEFWLLEADADNIPITTLSHHFDSSVQDGVKGALGKLMVQDVHMLYVFDTEGDASSFLITAVVLLGDLELDLYYQYNSTQPAAGGQTATQIAWGDTPPADITPAESGSWKFEAFLGATSPGSNLKQILTSIFDTTNLPDFLTSVPVNAAGGDNAAVKLIMGTVGQTNDIVLAFQIVLGDLDFTYATYWPASPAGGSSTSKTVLRIGVDKIPFIGQIPLIKSLPQPFDKLEYLYVDDETGVGLLASEIDDINGLLPDSAPKLDYDKTNGADADVAALQAGHHFMVVNKGEIILDHVFQNATTPDPSSAQSQSLVVTRTLVSTDDATEDDPAPTKGNLDVQLPFLSISAVTLKCKGLKLYLDIDGTLTLGPIQGSVIGFEIVLDISKVTITNLQNMLSDGLITFGIHGLGISVDQSPLEIAGVFIHNTTPTVEEYAGGVSVGFEAWQFLAVGAYEVINPPQGGQYKSVFVYAKLNGPLFTLAFATVSGVRVGFGYNSIVRSPTMAELPQFPFLDDGSDSGAGGDPITLIQSFMSGDKPWVSPKDDSYWVAAGLTLTAFGILSVTAVLMLGFHDGGVDISIFADGIAQMPPDVDADTTLFYVEIFMICELNTVEGYFTVQASLAPSSHILVSSCRLTGGFALENWFNPNAHSGDFVFTVGGYHPAYTPPQWYPPVDRLGVAFSLGGMIDVTGNCYFAITPKCVMGGGALHFGLNVGPVSAWLDFSLDVFIQFKPFYYTADLSVSVGCAMSINVWFVHVRISVSVGAQLHIHGPNPFGGVANVDFYLFSFTIHFGGSAAGPPPLPLLDFYEMVKTPGPATSRAGTSTPDPATSQLKFVLTNGILPNSSPPASQPTDFPDSGANAVWNTKAGSLGFNVDCDFALSDAHIVTFVAGTSGLSNVTQPIPLPAGEPTPPPIYSKPMHADATSTITSTLEVIVYQINSDGSQDVFNPPGGFTATLILKDVPAALWAAYDPASDPASASASPSPTALTDPSAPTVRLAMGVQLLAPPPRFYPGLFAFDSTPFPGVDFDPSIAFREPVLRLPADQGGGAPWEIPTADALQAVYLASGEVDKAASPKDRWAKVQHDWTTLADKAASVLAGQLDSKGVPAPGLLTMAATTLGWDVTTPTSALYAKEAAAAGGAGVGPAWLLNGAPPDLLLGDDFVSQYPVLPRYSADGTAT